MAKHIFNKNKNFKNGNTGKSDKQKYVNNDKFKNNKIVKRKHKQKIIKTDTRTLKEGGTHLDNMIRRIRSKLKKQKYDESIRLNGTPKKELAPEELDEMNSRTVFVGNLPITMTRKKLKQFFSKYGQVESARLRCSALNISNIPRPIALDKKNFHKKASSVNGYVKFVNKESVAKAISANGTMYEEHYLRVDHVNSEKSVQNTVFLGNLQFDVSDNMVIKHFKECGEIESVHLVRDNITGMGKGFGYVNFKSPSGIELALELDGSQLGKRPVRVKRAVKKLAEKRVLEAKQAEEKIKRKRVDNEVTMSGNEGQLKSDKEVVSFRPKRPKKEKKSKSENPKSSFQGTSVAAKKVINKKKTKKKFTKELKRKQLLEILNKK